MLKKKRIKPNYKPEAKFYTFEYNGICIKIEHDEIYDKLLNNKGGN